MQTNIYDIIKLKLAQKEIDISKCFLKHETILSNNTTGSDLELANISANNDMYFLISDLKNGTTIKSDEDILKIDDALKESLVGKSLLVFTGTIKITVPAAPTKQLIEFIRVSPIKK